MALCMAEKEFMFFTSTLVPSSSWPWGRTETLTSHLIEPSCNTSSAHVNYITTTTTTTTTKIITIIIKQ